jgi:ribosome maturation factor RimP
MGFSPAGGVDEEVMMPGGIRPAAGPVDDKRLAGIIQPVVAAAGLDLESVRVTTAGKRRLLRVVVDGDQGVSLDETADVSREISALLDASNVMGEVSYTLEVSSPGVDRPLTEPRHWRRAARRLVRVKVAGEGEGAETVQGRVLVADEAGVTLDVEGVSRAFPYGALGPGAIQVEFGPLPAIDDAGDLPAEADNELDDELDDGELDDDGIDKFEDEDLKNDEADLGGGGDGH